MKRKVFFISIILFLFFQKGISQSIIGTWKRTASIVFNADGTQKDMQKLMTKALPCTEEVKYVFETNGKMYTQTPKNCLPSQATEIVNWSIKGDAISLTSEGIKTITGEPTNYALSFKDGFVDFTHVYTADERTKFHVKAKKIVVTYKRI